MGEGPEMLLQGRNGVDWKADHPVAVGCGVSAYTAHITQ